MAKSRGTGRAKRPERSAPVQVLIFPKHARGVPRGFDPAGLDTLTDVRAVDATGEKTEPFQIPKGLFEDDDAEPTEIFEAAAAVPGSGAGASARGSNSRGKAKSAKRAHASKRPSRGKGAPVRLSPAVAAEMCLRGHALFESGRVDEARRVFETVVQSGVQEAFPHTMLGTIYLSLGKQERALARFEAALELDPRDVAARVYRGEIRLGRGKLKQAVEDLRTAQRHGSKDDPFFDRAERLLALAFEPTAVRRR